jgi:hypothetical protein
VSERPAALRRYVGALAVSLLTLLASASAAESEWQVVPSPNPSPSSGLADVAAFSPTDAWAVGSYFDGRRDRTLVERWNGAHWSIVRTPELGSGYSELSGVAALSRKHVWVVGDFTPEHTERALLLHYNGRKWSKARIPNPENWDELLDVSAVSPRDVWAVGNNYFGTFVLHWDGRSWREIEGPVGWINAVHAIGPDDVWVVGQRAPSQGAGPEDVIYASLAAHWDGDGWTMADTPNLPFHFNVFDDVSGSSSDDLWAVGSAWDSTKPHRPLIAHWDGAAWSLVPSADTGAANADLFGVTSLRPDFAWAVGAADGNPLLQRWNGSAWSVVAAPDAGEEEVLTAVARTPGEGAWAVGSSRVGGARKTLTLRSGT